MAGTYKHLSFTIKGASPLLMHNAQLSDPLNSHAKKMKALTSKKTKTDEMIADLRRLEWEGSLYLDQEKRVAIPGENIEAMLIKAGMQAKKGKDYKAGMFSDGPWRLIYDGPQSVEKLGDDPRFVDSRNVVINKNRVIRSRPVFNVWSLEFVITYLPTMLNKEQIITDMNLAGQIIGLGDYRPRFGRFEVTSAKEVA